MVVHFYFYCDMILVCQQFCPKQQSLGTKLEARGSSTCCQAFSLSEAELPLRGKFITSGSGNLNEVLQLVSQQQQVSGVLRSFVL